MPPPESERRSHIPDWSVPSEFIRLGEILLHKYPTSKMLKHRHVLRLLQKRLADYRTFKSEVYTEDQPDTPKDEFELELDTALRFARIGNFSPALTFCAKSTYESARDETGFFDRLEMTKLWLACSDRLMARPLYAQPVRASDLFRREKKTEYPEVNDFLIIAKIFNRTIYALDDVQGPFRPRQTDLLISLNHDYNSSRRELLGPVAKVLDKPDFLYRRIG